MIRGCKRIMSTALIFMLCMILGMTAYASETTQSGKEGAKEKELTEEEKRMQEELDKAYKIPTESNDWEGWEN